MARTSISATRRPFPWDVPSERHRTGQCAVQANCLGHQGQCAVAPQFGSQHYLRDLRFAAPTTGPGLYEPRCMPPHTAQMLTNALVYPLWRQEVRNASRCRGNDRAIAHIHFPLLGRPRRRLPPPHQHDYRLLYPQLHFDVHVHVHDIDSMAISQQPLTQHSPLHPDLHGK
jgi:hypothetical protein